MEKVSSLKLNMDSFPHSLYHQIELKAAEIAMELKRINRWQTIPLEPEQYRDMGAFGSNTMSFEQWIQFILLKRINSIIKERGSFPDQSMISAYAIRAFDGDSEAQPLSTLLYELDNLINHKPILQREVSGEKLPLHSESQGSETIPKVVYNLIEMLPHFTDESLESQLQKLDDLLAIPSPLTRKDFGKLLESAADKHSTIQSKIRIRNAIESLLRGERLAKRHDPDDPMRRYTEQRKNNSEP